MPPGASQVHGLRVRKDHASVDNWPSVSGLIHGCHVEIAEHLFGGKMPQLIQCILARSIDSYAMSELDADRFSRRGPVR